jgi:hypothetical protein
VRFTAEEYELFAGLTSTIVGVPFVCTVTVMLLEVVLLEKLLVPKQRREVTPVWFARTKNVVVPPGIVTVLRLCGLESDALIIIDPPDCGTFSQDPLMLRCR